MIIDSDNQAAEILTDKNPIDYVSLFSTLKLPYPQDNSTMDFMSPKAFSIVFRTLYSGSYLPDYLSEKSLELLTKTNFDKGLNVGVPASVLVAHKFGEHTEEYSDGTILSRELHDCGIVYLSDRPYLLCVMTKGKDFKKLESVISDISSLVYKWNLKN